MEKNYGKTCVAGKSVLYVLREKLFFSVVQTLLRCKKLYTDSFAKIGQKFKNFSGG